MRYIDITGQRYGRLVAIRSHHNDGKREYWECKCDCGNTVIVRKSHLRAGKILSCKCQRKENSIKALSTVRGLSKTRLHRIWQNMRNRCYYKNLPEFKYWGGRGITVCNEWKNSFLAFYDWSMANGYNDNLSIDRIDVDGNYCPDNCRWATAAEQQKNRRVNHCSAQA